MKPLVLPLFLEFCSKINVDEVFKHIVIDDIKRGPYSLPFKW
ncbi:MAG: hypothetical protein QW542_01400 [Thermoproteota archaeon]